MGDTVIMLHLENEMSMVYYIVISTYLIKFFYFKLKQDYETYCVYILTDCRIIFHFNIHLSAYYTDIMHIFCITIIHFSITHFV